MLNKYKPPLVVTYSHLWTSIIAWFKTVSEGCEVSINQDKRLVNAFNMSYSYSPFTPFSEHIGMAWRVLILGFPWKSIH